MTYKNPNPRATQDFAATLAAIAPRAKQIRLARMLRLYIAATEGLTQKQVAQQTGINESTVSRFLSGEQMPDGRAFSALLIHCLGEHESHDHD